MSCDFKVGDEVVCVDASANPFYGASVLVEGAIYTIKRVVHGGRAVHLVGLLSGPERCGLSDRGFVAKRFRKVQRRDLGEWLKTDVGNTDHIDRSVRERVGA